MPAYVGYLGGRAAGAGDQPNRWLTFSHGAAFVWGSVLYLFRLVWASFAGGLLYDLRYWLAKIGALSLLSLDFI